MIAKGQSVSKYYRFLSKQGDWIWMQTRATVIYNTTQQPQYVVCMNYVISQDEGRRHLMMEQEDLKDHDLPKGAIDVTSLASPGTSHSSGYVSGADDDHSYSSSKTREAHSPGAHSEFSSIDTNSQPHTPPSINSPVQHGANTAVTPTMLEERMQDFNTEDLNLIDMIDEILPPSGLGGTSLADSWLNGLDNDIEMMEADQNNGLPSLLDVSTDSDGLLMNILKESEKHMSAQQHHDRIAMETSAAQTSPGLNTMMLPPSTSAIITQSNVMLSAATMAQETGAMCMSSDSIPHTKCVGKDQINSIPMSVVTSMDSSMAGQAKANLTVSEFPNVIDSNNEFALKYAESIVDQQINATLASYLNDSDAPMDSTLGMQDATLSGLDVNPFNLLPEEALTSMSSLSQFLTTPSVIPSSASSPMLSSAMPTQPSCTSDFSTLAFSTGQPGVFVRPQGPAPVSVHTQRHNTTVKVSQPALSRSTSQPVLHKVSSQPTMKTQQSYPGAADHSYTSKQLHSPPHHHKSASHRNRNRHNHHQNNHSHPKGGSILEKFLLTKEKLDPNKPGGSDAALATAGLSQLHLGDMSRSDNNDLFDHNQQTMLKKLLTEEMSPRDIHRSQQEVIAGRRQSAGNSPTCGSPTSLVSCGSPTTLVSSFSLDTEDISDSLQLLGEDTGEMDKLWAPPPTDEATPSELDAVLREEMRQNDLWLEHCINELL